MLNMIKMDTYRLFRTKSLYVIYAIMIVVTALTTMTMATEMDTLQQIQSEIPEEMDSNIGISVMIPTEQGQKVTLFDMVYANLQGRAIVIFMVIFAVIFSTADMGSGYIKNIAGNVKNRGQLVLSKAIVLFLFTIMTMLSYLVVQTVSMKIHFGYVELGNISNFLTCVGIETMLHYGLVCVCMAVAIILRNNLFSMILSVCICFNVMNLLYSFVDKVLNEIGIENSAIARYTLSGKISMLPMEPAGSTGTKCALMVVLYILAFVGAGSYVFQKRDV